MFKSLRKPQGVLLVCHNKKYQMCCRWSRGGLVACVDLSPSGISSGDSSRDASQVVWGIRNLKRSRGKKSRRERRREIAKKVRELRGNLKRRCASVGSQGHSSTMEQQVRRMQQQIQTMMDDMRKLVQEDGALTQQSSNLKAQAAATATQKQIVGLRWQMPASMSVMAAKVEFADKVKAPLVGSAFRGFCFSDPRSRNAEAAFQKPSDFCFWCSGHIFLWVGSSRSPSRNSRRNMVLYRVESVRSLLCVFKPRCFFWREVARCCFGTLSRRACGFQIIFHSAILVGQKKHSLLDVVLTFCQYVSVRFVMFCVNIMSDPMCFCVALLLF